MHTFKKINDLCPWSDWRSGIWECYLIFAAIVLLVFQTASHERTRPSEQRPGSEASVLLLRGTEEHRLAGNAADSTSTFHRVTSPAPHVLHLHLRNSPYSYVHYLTVKFIIFGTFLARASPLSQGKQNSLWSTFISKNKPWLWFHIQPFPSNTACFPEITGF